MARSPPRGGGGSDGCVRCFGTNGRRSRWSLPRPCITAGTQGRTLCTQPYGDRRRQGQGRGRSLLWRFPSRRGQSRSVTWLPRGLSWWWRRWLAAMKWTPPPSPSSCARTSGGRSLRRRKRRGGECWRRRRRRRSTRRRCWSSDAVSGAASRSARLRRLHGGRRSASLLNL